MLSKLTFLPIVPVIVAAALAIAIRELRAGRGRALVRPLLVAGGLAIVLGVPFYAWAKFGGRGIVFGSPGTPVGPATPMELLSYAFELYVGQVGPVMDRIQGSGPHIFIDGLVGRLGWVDYGLPAQWNTAFEYLWLALLALAGVGVIRALVRRRTAWLEAAHWLLGAIPLLLVIAHSGLMTRHAPADRL